MFEIVFAVFIVIYTAISIKVEEWTTASLIDCSGASPLWFIQNPRPYNYIRSFFFLGALGMLFLLQNLPWYAGGTILFFAFFGAGVVGRKKAFSYYRRCWTRVDERADNTVTEEHRAYYLKEMKRTDQELQEMMDEKLRSH